MRLQLCHQLYDVMVTTFKTTTLDDFFDSETNAASAANSCDFTNPPQYREIMKFFAFPGSESATEDEIIMMAHKLAALHEEQIRDPKINFKGKVVEADETPLQRNKRVNVLKVPGDHFEEVSKDKCSISDTEYGDSREDRPTYSKDVKTKIYILLLNTQYHHLFWSLFPPIPIVL